jgi:hypothetical protein
MPPPEQPAEKAPVDVLVVRVRDTESPFDGIAEVDRLDDVAVGVSDARAQLEGICSAAVGRCRHFGGQVLH